MYGRYKKITLFGEKKEAKNGKVIEVYEDSDNALVIKETQIPMFFHMTKERRNEVAKWFANQVATTDSETRFLNVIRDALEKIDYDYEILTVPLKVEVENGIILRAIFTREEDSHTIKTIRTQVFKKCIEFFEYFLKNENTMLASIHELFLWYAWRIYKNWWNINSVCNDSSKEGNYSYYTQVYQEKCERYWPESKVSGGFYDAIGEFSKMVKIDDEHFAICGDCGIECKPRRAIGEFSEYQINKKFCETFYVCGEYPIEERCIPAVVRRR